MISRVSYIGCVLELLQNTNTEITLSMYMRFVCETFVGIETTIESLISFSSSSPTNMETLLNQTRVKLRLSSTFSNCQRSCYLGEKRKRITSKLIFHWANANTARGFKPSQTSIQVWAAQIVSAPANNPLGLGRCL